MKNELNIQASETKQSQLLKARSEGLEIAEKQSLRPLGKLWGMDVFSWYNPTIHELSATLATFPFPIFWMGNATTIEQMAKSDPTSLKALAWCAQYDNSQISLNSSVLSPMELFTATESIEETLTILKYIKQSKYMVLFTVAGNEWKQKMELVEQFVKTHSTK